MAKPLVDQPTARPTNKLAIAVLIGPAVTEIWGGVMAEIYPALAGASTSMLVGAIAALAVGYLVPDRANT
jgi:hypothetical protein